MEETRQNIELEDARCPICENSYNVPVLTGHSMDNLLEQAFHVTRCSNCGLLITDPRPAPSSIGIFYEGGFYEKEEGQLKKTVVNPVMNVLHKFRFRHVKKVSPKGRLLDVGCGKGKFVNTVAGQGWEAWGIEPSKRSLSYAKSEGGARIYGGRFEDVELPEKYFDVITMWHTLEHFYDPVQTLRQAGEKLKDNGYIVIRVPNSDSWDFRIGKEKWFHLDLPRHLYHFTPETMKKLLEKAGYQVVSMSTGSVEDNPIGTLQTVMAVIGFKPGAVFRLIKGDDGSEKKLNSLLAAGTAAFLLVPSLCLTGAAHLFGSGGTITVVAKKTNIAR